MTPTSYLDAFSRVLGQLAPEQRSLLRLHYVDGLTMDQLSRLYKTPRSTVARHVAAVREDILKEMHRVLVPAGGLANLCTL